MSEFLTLAQLQELEQDATAFQKFMTESSTTPNPPNASGTVTLRNGDVIPNLQLRLAQIALEVPVMFESGLLVDSSNFTVIYQGDVYVARQSAVPFTTTATFDESQWALLISGRSVPTPTDFETFTGVSVGGYVLVISVETRYIRVSDTDPAPDVDHTATGGFKYNVVSGNLVGLTDPSVAQTNLGISAYIKTLIDAVDAAAARLILGVGTNGTLSQSALQLLQSVWNTGTSTTEAYISPLKLATAITEQAAAKTFTSSQQTVTALSTLTVAHGLASTPTELDLYLVCTTADTPFAVGDRMRAPTAAQVGGTQYNTTISADGTNVEVRTGTAVSAHLDTGAAKNITPGSWRYVIIARI